MCIVWDMSRLVRVFAAALLITTFGLNVATIYIAANLSPNVFYNLNDDDSELNAIYGGTSIGLAAAFVSLASNLCATVLVALKVW